ncbi:cinnamoyl-CoA reductase 1-like isoform X1 [Selaginella moellendorffii]|uniref:cinnamoyl-CoA reductase 1-like isoform X1 n=1 Tax=Selaginella moellendorffii TaxID=88036 RepID=UPI000D1CEFF8|nr:cinnamoyl-CoA reductase 1-like isoform X1 [Selaginella moellendorffii]|eukprot:XP_024544226.1 cinnamoyl-CoA reductase 1-like isoform X1 [Selaginella moellendorffii]
MERACVIGAGGFIASWIVAKLLDRGYTVHGTVRDPDDDEKYGHLKKLPGASERLSLFRADVLDYDSLVPAVRGCHVVFHTACPVAHKFEDPDAVLKPAVDGTRNVMEACHKENIKRVVFTSSGAAMIFDPNRSRDQIIDESCWSDPEACRKHQQWYRLAKTESEKLVSKLGDEFGIRVVVICPVVVLGPILQSKINASVGLVATLMNGSKTSYPNIYFALVDVRDVAEAHIAGYEDPNASGRYFCIACSKLCKEMIETLKENFPQYSYPEKCETEADLFEKFLNLFEKFSNKKILSLIKEFIPYEKMLVDTVASLQEKGLL